MTTQWDGELKKKGLSSRDLILHQKRIKETLGQGQANYLKILDSFRIDNGGILPARFFEAKDMASPSGFVAFVPAAGAASRYFQPLQALREAIADMDETAIRSEVAKLKSDGASEWPLPKALTKLIATDASQKLPDSKTLSEALDEIAWPKALLPYKKNAASFLVKKTEEHKAIKGLMAEVYVAPLRGSEGFAKHLRDSGAKGNLQFLEQGPELSTLRFTRQGEPFRDADGELSVVPAGHGMLVRLFPEIQKKWTAAHSLLIRNIDNVIQDEPAALKDISLFLQQHQAVLEGLQTIRAALARGDGEAAADSASLMRSLFQSPAKASADWLSGLGKVEQSLWALLLDIFHCPLVLAESMRSRLGDRKALERLYQRPFNSLGQVPNNGRDVGGSPVRAAYDGGEVAICLELPHASPEDRKKFLENPKISTHFNPVFVAAEIPEDQTVYDLEQCPFWILAEKNIHGTPVVYHEIVLYEVLGNSFTANVIFPEIPRRLFNPHKSLLDGVKKA